MSEHPPSADSFPANIPGLGEHRPAGLLTALDIHPAVTRPWQGFANALLVDGALAPRQRELLVLRIAYRRRSAYVWGGHIRVARAAGLTDADIERIAAGGHAPGWAAVDAALLQAADSLLDGQAVGDATEAVLAGALDGRQLLEIPFVVGNYALVTMVVATLRLAPETGGAPLPGADKPE